jgi:multiple sugar transport system ATP-binding protein
MDEPLSNLDAKLRVQARAELSKLHQQLGTTFVYVTHDQVEAMTMGTRIAVINRGVLQQVDTPQALYDAPINVFVAGFMGSPAMNFFNAQLVQADDQLWVTTAALKLPIPDTLQSRYQDYAGREVIFGIRPESIYDPHFAPPNTEAIAVDARVLVIERMGHEAILYLALADETEVLARVDPRSQVQVGETVPVLFDMSRFHLFDQATEQAI